MYYRDMAGKLIIFSAPSGSGKSTIINELTTKYGLRGHFSISATSRAPRGEEKDGVHYHFLSTDEFKQRISDGDFLEYEEVYEGVYYGTLKSEIDKTLEAGETALLDIDVVGALNIKKVYGDQALTLFIQPPSIEVLRDRLNGRGTDAPDKINQRLAKAQLELSYTPLFDKKVINDELTAACEDANRVIKQFLTGHKHVLLFPGSFNPMHIGHLCLANYIVEQYSDKYDEVWLQLTPKNPFKDKDELLPTDFRAEWISHLICDYPKFRLHQEEESLTPPYYTINTIQHLKSLHPDTEFSLLIGADSLIDLPAWHRADELLKEVKIVAYPRPGYAIDGVSEELLKQVEILDHVPSFEVSSTALRRHIREGKALPYFLGTHLTHPLYRRLHQLLISQD